MVHIIDDYKNNGANFVYKKSQEDEKDVMELMWKVNFSRRLFFIIMVLTMTVAIINLINGGGVTIILNLTTILLFWALKNRVSNYPIGVMVLGLIIFLLFNVPLLLGIENLIVATVIVCTFFAGIINGVGIRNKKLKLGLEMKTGDRDWRNIN